MLKKHLDLDLDTNIEHIEVEINTSKDSYVKPRNMSYLYDIYSHYILKIEEKYIFMLDLLPNELKVLSKKDGIVNKYMFELERANKNPKFHEYMSIEENDRKIENSLKRQWKEGKAEGSYESKLLLLNH